MNFTEQEWIHIEDLRLLDETTVMSIDDMDNAIYERFPWIDDPWWVFLEIYPTIDSDNELIIREVEVQS